MATTWKKLSTKRPIKFKDKYARAVSDILTDIMTEDVEEPYTPELRTSRLPICGLLHTLELLGDRTKLKNASMDFYTEIGDAVHKTYQKRLTLSKKWGKLVFGDWKCDSCEEIAYTRRTRPKSPICPVCNKGIIQYEEVEFKYRKRLGGHVDMILKFSDGTYWLLEFKTTSAYNIIHPDLYLPNQKHKMQAESYVVSLAREEGIEISRYFIIYISRDKTQKSKLDDRHHIVFPFKVNPNVLGVRKGQMDRVVKVGAVVETLLKDKDDDTLEELDKLRPCHSREDYEDPETGMTHAFQFNDPECIFLKSCIKAKGLTKPAQLIREKLKGK